MRSLPIRPLEDDDMNAWNGPAKEPRVVADGRWRSGVAQFRTCLVRIAAGYCRIRRMTRKRKLALEAVIVGFRPPTRDDAAQATSHRRDPSEDVRSDGGDDPIREHKTIKQAPIIKVGH